MQNQFWAINGVIWTRLRVNGRNLEKVGAGLGCPDARGEEDLGLSDPEDRVWIDVKRSGSGAPDLGF